jgi:hypothetical protein
MSKTWISMALLAVTAHAGPSLAAEPAATPKLDRCLESINVIGASVGHVEKQGPSGKPMLHFLVRSNGAEYDVVCEADTGLLKDVSLRVRGNTQTN